MGKRRKYISGKKIKITYFGLSHTDYLIEQAFKRIEFLENELIGLRRFPFSLAIKIKSYEDEIKQKQDFLKYHINKVRNFKLNQILK